MNTFNLDPAVERTAQRARRAVLARRKPQRYQGYREDLQQRQAARRAVRSALTLSVSN